MSASHSFTVDASVWVSRAILADVHHVDSRAFLARIADGAVVLCPTLVVVEVTAAIARRTRDAALANRAGRLVRYFPGLRLASLTIQRSRLAQQIAASHFLRGADAVYVSLSQEWGTTLVTWDQEMLTRVPGSLTPTDWLAHNLA